MTVNDIRFGGVMDQVVAALICLVGCSRSLVPDSARGALTTNMPQQEAKLSLPLERVSVMVPLGFTNCQINQNLVCQNLSSPPPWQRGSYFAFTFRKATVPGHMEQWVLEGRQHACR
jgi:hypothetical protein